MRHQTPDPIHGYQGLSFGGAGGAVRGRTLQMQTMMHQQSQGPDPRLGAYQNMGQPFSSSSPAVAAAARAKAPMQMQSMMQQQAGKESIELYRINN